MKYLLIGGKSVNHNCKKCIYYNEKLNLCDGFAYMCECLESFCPMYETEEMIERRKHFLKDNSKISKKH